MARCSASGSKEELSSLPTTDLPSIPFSFSSLRVLVFIGWSLRNTSLTPYLALCFDPIWQFPPGAVVQTTVQPNLRSAMRRKEDLSVCFLKVASIEPTHRC